MSESGLAHLACGEVAALLQDAPQPDQWLGESERRRLAAVTTKQRRAQFLAARWQARWLLAQVLGGLPQDWMLDAPSDAPPQVRGRAGLHLSISHSGERTACALADRPVGLDLEQPRRRRDIAGLVALVCTRREQAMFAALDQAEHEALFYEVWTVKEAWLKRRGEWIAPRRLAQIETEVESDGELRTWRGNGWHLAVSARQVRWWTAEPGFSAAWSIIDRG